ncbi:TIR domain-containing protein [Bradyrhizobium sp. TM233]|uniref:TIR domain-containing protein n=1 Tax=Bradyrhizobium sp. TM233 TaxID=2599801 RepID=UPI0027D5E33D|nr:TIR domain-containing protein [Bradyrhizobium sp. TM233]
MFVVIREIEFRSLAVFSLDEVYAQYTHWYMKGETVLAKRVFFSFHYQDVIDFRANVVRQHWLTKPDREVAGFFDASIWESAKRTGPVALKRMINSSIDGTSVTCVLIGSETFERPWVRYEILKSFRKGNHLLAVHINSIKGRDQRTKPLGPNPLNYVGVTFSQSGDTATLWEKVNGTWKEYSEIDGSSSYRTGGVAQQYRGNGYNLGNWYTAYDWIANDGFNKFSDWIG